MSLAHKVRKMTEESTERMEKLEDASPEWIYEFLELNKDHGLPKELLRKCLNLLISQEGLISAVITLKHKGIWERLTRGRKSFIPQSLREKILAKIFDDIEKRPSVGKKEREILDHFLYSFRYGFKEGVEKILKKFLDSEDSKNLEWLLGLYLGDFPGFLEIRKSVLKKIIAGNDLKLISKVVERKELSPELRETGTDKIIAGEDSSLLYPLFERFNLERFEELEHQKIQLIEKMLSQKDPALAYLILRNTPDLLSDLQKEAIDIIHSEIEAKMITPFVLEAIKEILGQRWILMTDNLNEQIRKIDKDVYPGRRSLERIGDEIPVFSDRLWFLRDKETKLVEGKTLTTGALLGIARLNWRDYSQAILLLDPSNFKGYAYQTNPEAKTVKEAIAYSFDIDPEKFKGFVEEK